MRIAYFSESLPPITDGVSHTLSCLRETLIEEGHDFIFFSPFQPQPDAWDNRVRKIVSLPFPLYRDYRFALPAFHDLKSVLDNFAPDIIHACNPFLLGKAAYRYAREAGIPAVSSYHTRFVSYFKYYGFHKLEWFGWWYLRRFYNQTERIFVPSRATIEELKSRGFSNLALWERGIDTRQFSPSHADEQLRREWSPEGYPIAIYVGRLVKEKDIDILIKADRILKDRKIEYKLVFVGEGPARGELTRALPDAYLAGFLEGQELARAYASADIFVFPSTTESFGNVVLEAAASGLPAIVSSEGGVANLVRDGETGYVTQAWDAHDFASKLAILLTNDIARNAFSLRAVEFASTRSWSQINRVLLRQYEEVIGNGFSLKHNLPEGSAEPAGRAAGQQHGRF